MLNRVWKEKLVARQRQHHAEAIKTKSKMARLALMDYSYLIIYC
jgi:hypothetical protein